MVEGVLRTGREETVAVLSGAGEWRVGKVEAEGFEESVAGGVEGVGVGSWVAEGGDEEAGWHR